MMTRLLFDKDAIAIAKQELKITKPVMLRAVNYRNNGVLGWYKNVNGKHYISIVKQAKNPSEVLWHELTHASQAERTPDDNHHELYKEKAGGPGLEYAHNEYEIEARVVAHRNQHKILVRKL